MECSITRTRIRWVWRHGRPAREGESRIDVRALRGMRLRMGPYDPRDLCRANSEVAPGLREAFDHAGEERIDNLARWDGTRWTRMGAGFMGEVRALAIHDGALVAAWWSIGTI